MYVLNYLINRRIERKEKEMIALFIDLKAAFDSVDRGILIREIRKLGIKEDLKRAEEVIRETKGRVKIGEKLGENF